MAKFQVSRRAFLWSTTILFLLLILSPGKAFSEYLRSKYLSIDGGATYTTSKHVVLSISRPTGAVQMRIGNDLDDLLHATWRSYTSRVNWTLPFSYEEKTVYVQFRDKENVNSLIYSDSIILREETEAEKNKTYIRINGSQASTKYRQVTLYITKPKGMKDMRIANSLNGLERVGWRPYKSSLKWNLGFDEGIEKTVYVQFRDELLQEGKVYSDIIKFEPVSLVDMKININSGTGDTSSRSVLLQLSNTDGVEGIKVSNSNSKSVLDAIDFVPVQKEIPWILSDGKGRKTVYVYYLDSQGREGNVVDTINYIPKEGGLKGGTLLKSPGSGIYYLGFDDKIHPFSQMSIYHSWYADFSSVNFVSDIKLSQYPVGDPVCVRPGTFLIQFSGDTNVYAVEPGCVLRQIRSAVEARLVYGDLWNERILRLPNELKAFYVMESQSIQNNDENIVDRDHDGVELSVEQEYGSLDSNADSDGDTLSDYEEIFVWLSNPISKDTDFDGVDDAKEILQGRSPVGSQSITTLPDEAFEFPKGALVDKVNSSVAKGAQKYFIIHPAYTLPQSVKKTASSKDSSFPTRRVGGTIIPL